jgi:outer membrane murein-binding lipoprotein Lpp
MIRKFAKAAALAGVLVLFGCSSEAPKPEETKVEKKKDDIPTGAITGMTAFYRIDKVAHSMAPDLQVASITGSDAPGVKSEEGKFPMWTVIYVSPSQQQATTFVFSTVEQGATLRGINKTGSLKWGGPSRDAMPFAYADFSVDSDKAYAAAAEKAKDWIAKNPSIPLTTVALGNATRFPAPLWFFQWGDKKTGGYQAFVNATTGTVFENK